MGLNLAAVVCFSPPCCDIFLAGCGMLSYDLPYIYILEQALSQLASSGTGVPDQTALWECQIQPLLLCAQFTGRKDIFISSENMWKYVTYKL